MTEALHARPRPDDRFVSAEWDGRCVVFDRHLGATHALDALASALWRLPEDERGGDRALMALAEQFEAPSPDVLANAVEDALAKLRRLELI